jgi:hypothetical protein
MVNVKFLAIQIKDISMMKTEIANHAMILARLAVVL